MIWRCFATFLAVLGLLFAFCMTGAQASLQLAKGASSAAQVLTRLAEGQISGVKIDIPWGSVQSGTTEYVVLTDVGIETNDTGVDYVFDSMISFQSESETLAGGATEVTSFAQLADCEYGWNQNGAGTENRDARWNDASFTYADPSNMAEQAFFSDDGADGEVYLKFCEGRSLNNIVIGAEHFNNNVATDHDFFLENIAFYDTSDNELTPTEQPFWFWDAFYTVDVASETRGFFYNFDGTEHPAPTVRGLIVDIQYSSGDVDLGQIGLGLAGEPRTSDISFLSAAHTGTAITGIYQLGDNEIGTTSTNAGDSNIIGDGLFTFYDTPSTTVHVFDQADSTKRLFIKFASARELELATISIKDTVLNGDPIQQVTIYDEGYNELFNTHSGYINYSSAFSVGGTSDTNRAYIIPFSNVLLTDTKPVRLAAPYITGTNEVGQTLTCNAGTYTNTVDSRSYRWLRDSVAISGETSTTYVRLSADYDTEIQCEETATNTNGSVVVKSGAVFETDPAGRIITDWTAVGTATSVNSFSSPAALSSTELAVLNGTTLEHYTVDLGTNAFSLTATGLSSVAGGTQNGACKVDGDTVAIISNTDDAVTFFTHSGGTWSQEGNAYSRVTGSYPVCEYVSDGNIVVSDDANMELITWDGTDASRVGNQLSVSGRAGLAVYASSPVTAARMDDTSDDIIMYSHDGTDFTQTGSTYNLPVAYSGAYDMLHVGDGFMVYPGDGTASGLVTVQWDGSTFTEVDDTADTISNYSSWPRTFTLLTYTYDSTAKIVIQAWGGSEIKIMSATWGDAP